MGLVQASPLSSAQLQPNQAGIPEQRWEGRKNNMVFAIVDPINGVLVLIRGIIGLHLDRPLRQRDSRM